MPTGVYKHRPASPETRAKMSVSHKWLNTWSKGKTGEKCNAWKGDKVGYHGIHVWIKKMLGKPSQCENCGTTESYRFEWANISGQYLRDISDWVRLCVRCHRLIDGNHIRERL